MKKPASSAVREAAHALRAMISKCQEGELLGSEEELIARLGVSRPTLRQASALVSQEQLLTVKRGVGGGYFARRPTSSGVANMAAIYLQTHKAGLDEVVSAIEPIRVEITRLATQNRDPEHLSAMRDYLARERQLDSETLHYRDFLKAEREFSRLLGAMGGNRVLSLFLNILYDFASLVERDLDVWVNRPDRVAHYRSLRIRMAEAIVEGDTELAVLTARRCTREVSEWMMDRLSRASANGMLTDIHSGVDGAMAGLIENDSSKRRKRSRKAAAR